MFIGLLLPAPPATTYGGVKIPTPYTAGSGVGYRARKSIFKQGINPTIIHKISGRNSTVILLEILPEQSEYRLSKEVKIWLQS